MTVEDIVAEPLDIHKYVILKERKRVMELLELGLGKSMLCVSHMSFQVDNVNEWE